METLIINITLFIMFYIYFKNLNTYVNRNKIYFNVITQNRFSINKMIGDDIIDCTIMAEHIVRNREHYYRWTDYT